MRLFGFRDLFSIIYFKERTIIISYSRIVKKKYSQFLTVEN